MTLIFHDTPQPFEKKKGVEVALARALSFSLSFFRSPLLSLTFSPPLLLSLRGSIPLSLCGFSYHIALSHTHSHKLYISPSLSHTHARILSHTHSHKLYISVSLFLSLSLSHTHTRIYITHTYTQKHRAMKRIGKVIPKTPSPSKSWLRV